MNKVWFLDDPGLDGHFGTDRTLVLEPDEGKIRSTEQSKVALKNPAIAFSLSLLIWGGGQFYLGKRRSATIFLLAMILCCVSAPVLVYFQSSINLAQPTLIWSVMIIILLGLLLWMVNAADAYFRTSRGLDEPFLGLDRKIWPISASLLLPGWGQFLNGQPKKGCFFLLFAVTGIYTILLLLSARQIMPLLESATDQRLFEIFLLVAIALIPVVLLMWIVSAYDAFRSCEEYVRHKQRSQMAGYRLQGRELLAEFVPQCSAVLGMMLAISLGVQGIPKQYYLDYLNGMRISMLHDKLTIIPGLLNNFLEVFRG